MRQPRFTSIVRDLPALVPFVGPEATERQRGRAFRARLGANESLFGPSPRAIDAMRAACENNWKYSDPENHDLRTGIAAFHGVGLENVVVGEGIDGLLGLGVRMLAEPGSTVVTSDGAYPTFKFHVAAQGAELAKVPFRDDREDLPQLIAAAQSTGARIVYVSNPNNPMGSWWPAKDVSELISSLPNGAALFLDEAYCDTAPGDAIPPLDVNNPQVIRYRTFSKAYGLAGARIGYAIGERAIIAAFDKVRNHYGINRIGQIGALAALQDQSYLAETVGRIAASRNRIAEIAGALGLKPLVSAANFVTIDCGRDGALAAAVLDGLLSRDVFARKPAVPPLDRCIRVSCGLDRDLDVLAEVLPQALAGARSA